MGLFGSGSREGDTAYGTRGAALGSEVSASVSCSDSSLGGIPVAAEGVLVGLPGPRTECTV